MAKRQIKAGDASVEIRPVEPAPPPDFLGPEAATEWRRISATLHEAGMLANVDQSALAAYCCLFARWVRAERDLQARGELVPTLSGGPKPNPYLRIARDALVEMRRYLSEFGMSPKSRRNVMR